MNDLTEQDLIHLVKAYKIQLDLGIHNHTMDELFEQIRKSEMAQSFCTICDLFKL